jgi:hypothetical protein
MTFLQQKAAKSAGYLSIMENIGQQIHHFICLNAELAFLMFGLIFVTPYKRAFQFLHSKMPYFYFFIK